MNLPLVARAFIFNPDGQILLAKQKSSNIWVLPGGHMEKNENIHQTIQREIKEEFGISARFFEIDNEEILFHKGKKLKNYPLPLSIYELNYKNSKGEDKSRIEYIFLMETDDKIKDIDKNEILQYKWFDPDEILSMNPNIETFDFIIEILEKIVSIEENF